jgi:chaperonin GroES
MFTRSPTAATIKTPLVAHRATRRTARRAVTTAGMKSSECQAMGDRVLVLADKAESQTKGGLFLAGGAGAGGPGSSVTGKVASVGENVKGIKKGDAVLINGFSGTEVEFEDGEKGKFINAIDVLAVLG